jgi:Fe-S cluster assembly protein SufD
MNANPAMGSVESHLQSFERLDDAAPDTLRRLRHEALDRFASLGFPTPADENWKYTDVAAIARTAFRLAAGRPAPSAALRAAVDAAALPDARRLVFLDGIHAPELTSRSSGPLNLRVDSLATALQREPALVLPHLGRIADFSTHAFTALNTAFVRDGAFVRIPPGTALEQPVQLLFVSSGGDSQISHPRVLILAEESAEATVIETYVGADGAPYFTNAVTEVLVGANAAVRHVRLQHDGDRAFHVAAVHARQAADSRLRSHAISVGAALSRCDIQTLFAEPGAECSLDGLYLAAGSQHVDHHTTIDHAQPHCTSRELYKGVLDGKSTGVFNGKVYVRPEAQKSDAGQTNKNLLLSDAATIDTKPQLEIFADDVRCSHGATVGQLDADALFYLRARGIGRAEARQILVYAFANEIIDRLPVESVRARLEDLLRGRFRAEAAGEVLQ